VAGAARAGEDVPAPVPRFGHGAEVVLPSGLVVLGCFHVSQQNTFTGRLTEAMLDERFTRAKELADRSDHSIGTRKDHLERPNG
jgi:uracil-DNA glycosylase